MGDIEQEGQRGLGSERLEETFTSEQNRTQLSPNRGEVPTGLFASGSTSQSPGSPPLAGRYTVLELLGQGGMGVVLAAYDSRLDRRVALKLLRRGSEPDAPQLAARMVREAQAMARLNHPNVVAIYDAVPLKEGSILIAMEMVEGQTLRRWSEQKPRTWRETLVTYLAAGRGLAAAHAAGIVHRDFKPDNVLVGKDGRVRVTDFGLARAETSHSPDSSPGVPVSPSTEAWARPLTMSGALLGTPLYMAPEQVLGRAADARSDLFAFCVSLHQALHGQHPFSATTLAELTRAQLDGRINPPPLHSNVPEWLTRTVLRGLKADPQQRPASMMELITALEGHPEERHQARVRTWGLAAVMVVMAGTLVLARQPPLEQPCQGGARRLEGVWDTARKQALGQAFGATGKPNADESWTRTAQVLDTYSQGWVSMHAEACEATRVRGEQSDEVLSLRMACLERRLHALRALTDVYSRADAPLVDQAAKAAHALPPLEGCANVEALRATLRPPEDPPTREKVAQLRLRLAEARALFDSGQFKPALERIRTLAQEAVALRYRPLQAELRGALEEKAGDFAASEATLRQAVWAAEAGRHDEVIASASARLVRSGMLQAEFEQGREWAEHTRAVLERMGGDDRIEAFVTNALGAILLREDKMDGSLEHFRRVVALRQKVYPAEHPEVAAGFNNLGAALTKLNRYEEGRATRCTTWGACRSTSRMTRRRCATSRAP